MRSRLSVQPRRRRLRRAPGDLVLAFFIGVFGCAGPRDPSHGIQIARSGTFDLLEPKSLGASLSLEQIVDAKSGGHSFSFHCLLEVDERELVLVGLTPFNTRAFTLTLRDKTLLVETAPGVELPADPARVLADLQIALWPKLTSLRGLDVVESVNAAGLPVRELVRDEKAVIRVTYRDPTRWRGDVKLEHLERDYVLDVHVVRAEALAP